MVFRRISYLICLVSIILFLFQTTIEFNFTNIVSGDFVFKPHLSSYYHNTINRDIKGGRFSKINLTHYNQRNVLITRNNGAILPLNILFSSGGGDFVGILFIPCFRILISTSIDIFVTCQKRLIAIDGHLRNVENDYDLKSSSQVMENEFKNTSLLQLQKFLITWESNLGSPLLACYNYATTGIGNLVLHSDLPKKNNSLVALNQAEVYHFKDAKFLTVNSIIKLVITLLIVFLALFLAFGYKVILLKKKSRGSNYSLKVENDNKPGVLEEKNERIKQGTPELNLGRHEMKNHLHEKGGSFDFFFIKENNKYLKINTSQITHFKGYGDYVQMHTFDGVHLLNLKMSKVASVFASCGFVRVHRSYVVSIENIDLINKKTIKIDNKEIPVSDSYWESFIEEIPKI